MAHGSAPTGNPAAGYIADNPPTAATICCVALNCDQVFTSRAAMLEHNRNHHKGPDNVHPPTHYACPVPGCQDGQLILRSAYPGHGRFDEFRRHFETKHENIDHNLQDWLRQAIYLSVRAKSDMAPVTVALEKKQFELKEKVADIRVKEREIEQLKSLNGDLTAKIHQLEAEVNDLKTVVACQQPIGYYQYAQPLGDAQFGSELFYGGPMGHM